LSLSSDEEEEELDEEVSIFLGVLVALGKLKVGFYLGSYFSCYFLNAREGITGTEGVIGFAWTAILLIF